ncbi:hypothetical protein BDF21DRAFT_405143 [Thamnidium elegans]|nr:hypothetical protein BDF21DRAFT_405143 [Thamnidium elegans]
MSSQHRTQLKTYDGTQTSLLPQKRNEITIFHKTAYRYHYKGGGYGWMKAQRNKSVLRKSWYQKEPYFMARICSGKFRRDTPTTMRSRSRATCSFCSYILSKTSQIQSRTKRFRNKFNISRRFPANGQYMIFRTFTFRRGYVEQDKKQKLHTHFKYN